MKPLISERNSATLSVGLMYIASCFMVLQKRWISSHVLTFVFLLLARHSQSELCLCSCFVRRSSPCQSERVPFGHLAYRKRWISSLVLTFVFLLLASHSQSELCLCSCFVRRSSPCQSERVPFGHLAYRKCWISSLVFSPCQSERVPFGHLAYRKRSIHILTLHLPRPSMLILTP